MAVKIRERNGKSWLYVGVALLASPALAVEPYEIATGLWTCPRGYVIQGDSTCKPDTEIPHGPVVEISELLSAGDGAPTTCPSSGCGSNAPSYLSAYSGPAYGGWSHSRWFRGRGLTFGRPGLFAQTRSFAPGGFLAAPRHVHSMPERRSHPGFAGGKFFAGSSPRGVPHHRGGKGRAWRQG
jgi:hypothetical protein